MKERERILADFRDGIFPVLNNCGILTTGYDEPSIDAIIMNRATMSLPLWLQCQGRGSRPFPNKLNFTVIDFGGNHDRHGLWNEQREWSLKPPRKKGPAKAAPVKRCPACQAMLPASVMVCEYCDYEFPPAASSELAEGVAVLKIAPVGQRRISTLSLEELAVLQKKKVIKHTLIWRIVRSKGATAIEQYAKIMKYSYGWVGRMIDEIADSKFKDKLV